MVEAHALDLADIKGTLGAAITGTFRFELAMRFLFQLCLLQRREPRFDRISPSWATLASSAP